MGIFGFSNKSETETISGKYSKCLNLITLMVVFETDITASTERDTVEHVKYSCYLDLRIFLSKEMHIIQEFSS